MNKCSTCERRMNCAGMAQFMCENGDYKDYIPDEDALAEVKRELFGEEKKKEEKSNVKKFMHVVLENEEEFLFDNEKNKIEFEGEWMKVMSGFGFNETVFVVHKSNVAYVYTDDSFMRKIGKGKDW